MGRMIQNTRIGAVICFKLSTDLTADQLKEKLLALDLDKQSRSDLEEMLEDEDGYDSAEELWGEFRANIDYYNDAFIHPYEGLESEETKNILLPADNSTYIYDGHNEERIFEMDGLTHKINLCEDNLKTKYAEWIEFLATIGEVSFKKGVLIYSDEIA